MLMITLVSVLFALASTVDCQLQDFQIAGRSGKALICKPEGKGPFPTVIYNHGAIVDFRGYDGAAEAGYDLKGMMQKLAEAGFLAVAPIRQSGRGRLASHIAEIQQALDYVKTLPEADTTRMALMGFSRGGALTLTVSFHRPEFRSVILEAPAFRPNQLKPLFAQVDTLSQTFLLLIEKSDNPAFNQSLDMVDSLLTERGAHTHLIRYDRGGGHRLFWKVDYYWDDVIAFLKRTLDAELPNGR